MFMVDSMINYAFFYKPVCINMTCSCPYVHLVVSTNISKLAWVEASWVIHVLFLPRIQEYHVCLTCFSGVLLSHVL